MLTKIRLTKAWGPHAAGDVLEVDELRAAKLYEMDIAVPYVAAVAAPEPVRRAGKR